MKIKMKCSVIGGLIITSAYSITFTVDGTFNFITAKGVVIFLIMTIIFSALWRAIIYIFPVLCDGLEDKKWLQRYIISLFLSILITFAYLFLLNFF